MIFENKIIGKIKDVCLVIAGQSPEGKYYNSLENGLPFYQGKKEFQEKYIGEAKVWTTKTTKEAIKNDILMSVRAPVGPVNYAIQKCCIGRGLAAIRASDKINIEYLFYFLLKHESEIIGNTGAVFNSINKSQIGNIKLPIPPLQEQKQIVAILDQAFEAIDQAKANIEKNIENAKELFQSKLNAIFSQKGDGWEEKSLGEIYDVRDGTHDSPKYQAEGYPLITSKNLKDNLINYDNVKFISDEDFININKRSKVDIGDVLFAMIGTIGNPVVITKQPDFAIKNVALFKVPNEQNSMFLRYFLNSVVSKMISEAKGTTQSFVGLGYLRNFPINIPPLNEQIKIVEMLNYFESNSISIENIYKQKLTNLEDLKKSILQKAFAGELTQTKESSLTAEQKHALLIVLCYSRHRNAGTELTFGHTKSEKMIHMFENYVGIELNRTPIKDAAGPNDFHKVINIIEPLAKKEKYYSITNDGIRYTYGFDANSFKGIKKLESQFTVTQKKRVEEIISLFLEEKTEQSELYATVYAAWNNLIIKNEEINDEAIVYEARENWHSDKLKIGRIKFFDTINKLRTKNIIPDGKGKIVEKKTLF